MTIPDFVRDNCMYIADVIANEIPLEDFKGFENRITHLRDCLKNTPSYETYKDIYEEVFIRVRKEFVRQTLEAGLLEATFK